VKRVKQIWFSDNNERPQEVVGYYSTGLVLELEDGTFLRHQQGGALIPFERFTPAPTKNTEACPGGCIDGSFYDEDGNQYPCWRSFHGTGLKPGGEV